MGEQRGDVFMADDDDMREAVGAELALIDMTFPELEAMAVTERWPSELHRRTWSSLKSLREFAP